MRISMVALFMLVGLGSCKPSAGVAAPASGATASTAATASVTPDAGQGVDSLAAERSCVSDVDCTLVTEDCCPCSALGRLTAIRKDKIAVFSARRAPVCSTVVCPPGMSSDPTCAAVRAVCTDGRCEPGSAVSSSGAAGAIQPIKDAD